MRAARSYVCGNSEIADSTMTDIPAAGPEIVTDRLSNGLDVVIIPDRRAPVATHMVWYRNGSADDPPGKSGIAHFLEHLMFKGTEKHPKGTFSHLVSELGGQENAFTSMDYTAYFQRVAKEHLATMMAMEADRMTNLVLADEDVIPERDVVLEERRMRTDSDPAAQLAESVAATLYVNHPYGTPIIGWQHEIEGLGREDALAYYRRFYTPENAILVVSGDVEPDVVLGLARETYGKVPASGAAPVRERRLEPPARAHRRVELADAKVEQPNVQRSWVVPSYGTATGREAFALDVLAQVLGGGPTGRLYRRLVTERAIAVSAGAWYMGTAVDASRFAIYAVPREGVALLDLERALEEVIAEVAAGDIPAAELERVKTRLVADMVYAQDSQATMARMYGAALAVGGSIDDVLRWPDEIETVTAAEVAQAARDHLSVNRAVTGHLMKAAA
jgi:zinc protease